MRTLLVGVLTVVAIVASACAALTPRDPKAKQIVGVPEKQVIGDSNEPR